MAFVLDASPVLAWHFDDESDPIAEHVSWRSGAEDVVVPAHWFAEIANGLLSGERKKRTTVDRVAAFMARIDVLRLQVDAVDGREAFTRLLPLARLHGLTIYDTYYLELSERRGLPLATLDRQLASAARAAGIAIVGDEM